jgi:nitroimidazol reductase NimA-like FMN-containing flavoprotein (pyridoxamine 5'-phosphate oxidase superfamily)
VIAYGTFDEISNEETRENVLSKLYSRLPQMTPVESKLVEGLKETIVFRVKVDEITGVGEEWLGDCKSTLASP